MTLTFAILLGIIFLMEIGAGIAAYHLKGQVLILIHQRRICKPFNEPRNRFPATRAGVTTLFDVPAQHGYIGWRYPFIGIDPWAP
jgi:hypothetical protein